MLPGPLLHWTTRLHDVHAGQRPCDRTGCVFHLYGKPFPTRTLSAATVVKMRVDSALKATFPRKDDEDLHPEVLSRLQRRSASLNIARPTDLNVIWVVRVAHDIQCVLRVCVRTHGSRRPSDGAPGCEQQGQNSLDLIGGRHRRRRPRPRESRAISFPQIKPLPDAPVGVAPVRLTRIAHRVLHDVVNAVLALGTDPDPITGGFENMSEVHGFQRRRLPRTLFERMRRDADDELGTELGTSRLHWKSPSFRWGQDQRQATRGHLWGSVFQPTGG